MTDHNNSVPTHKNFFNYIIKLFAKPVINTHNLESDLHY